MWVHGGGQAAGGQAAPEWEPEPEPELEVERTFATSNFKREYDAVGIMKHTASVRVHLRTAAHCPLPLTAAHCCSLLPLHHLPISHCCPHHIFLSHCFPVHVFPYHCCS